MTEPRVNPRHPDVPMGTSDRGRSWWRLQAWTHLLPALLLCASLLVVPAPLWSLDSVGVATASGGLQAEDTGRLEAGASLFEANCVGCHVGGGNVIRRGRTLRLAALERAGLADPEAIARVVAAGLGQMSGYGDVLGEQGTRQVADWVWLQAQAGWPRPARTVNLPST